MMSTIKEGRGRTSVFLDKLEISIQGTLVRMPVGTLLDVTYQYAPFIRATEDEPSCPEEFEIVEMHVTVPMYFTNNDGVQLSISTSSNLWDILTAEQVDYIEIELRKQSKGAVNYVDNDSLRHPVNSRMQQELGFGLKDYDWSDK